LERDNATAKTKTGQNGMDRESYGWGDIACLGAFLLLIW
jgi:hypothetical protein